MLSGLRVIELASEPAQAICGKFLADLGAEVILVEPTKTGCALRWRPPFVSDRPGPERSVLFQYAACGKQSVTLDLSHADGRAIALKLLASAALVIDDGQVLSKRIDERWRETFPRLVRLVVCAPKLRDSCASSSTDQLLCAALGGWMAQLGEAERAPLAPNSETATAFVAGVIAGSLGLAAAMRAEVEGTGCEVEVRHEEALAFTTRFNETYYSYTGFEIKRMGRTFFGFPTYRIFEACDGYVTCAAATDPQIETLLALAGIDDPRFATRADREANREELVEALARWFKTNAKDEIFHRAQAARVPMAKIATIDEVFSLEQLKARDYFATLHHPELGEFMVPGVPWIVDRQRPGVPRRAPLLGEHSRALICDELGYSESDYRALVDIGVI